MKDSNHQAMRRWLPVLLAVQIVLAVVAAGTAWAARTDKPSPPGSAPDPTSVTRPLTIESAYQLGLKQAASWEPNAQLINVNMQVDWPGVPPPATVTELPPGGWVTMTFAAPWDHAGAEGATLGLFFERGSGRLYGQSTTKWQHPISKSISPDRANVDSTTALLAAELAGGTAYRAECPKFRAMSRIALTTSQTTEQEPGEKLEWLISYTDLRNRKVGYQVIVDSGNGNIVRVSDTRSSCDP